MAKPIKPGSVPNDRIPQTANQEGLIYRMIRVKTGKSSFELTLPDCKTYFRDAFNIDINGKSVQEISEELTNLYDYAAFLESL